MKSGGSKERRWSELEEILDAAERGRPDPRIAEVPRRFREVCADLALAQSRIYALPVIERLNALVIRCRNFVYRGRGGFDWEKVARFLAVGIPQAVRREWRLFWVCSVLFWVPFFVLFSSASNDHVWAQAVLGADGMGQMDEMYGDSERQVENLRSKYGSNFMMFCYYIENNIGIDFRIFAGGMAAGVGTVFFLFFNGIFMGASAGYVQSAGDPTAFWSFVSSHASWELTGMILAGVAGMRLGIGVLRPGRLRRSESVRRAAMRALPLLGGAAVMTFVAACIEGFWSARALPPEWKYAAGAVGWVVVGAWLSFAGRGSGRGRGDAA